MRIESKRDVFERVRLLLVSTRSAYVPSCNGIDFPNAEMLIGFELCEHAFKLCTVTAATMQLVYVAYDSILIDERWGRRSFVARADQ